MSHRVPPAAVPASSARGGEFRIARRWVLSLVQSGGKPPKSVNCLGRGCRSSTGRLPGRTSELRSTGWPLGRRAALRCAAILWCNRLSSRAFMGLRTKKDCRQSLRHADWPLQRPKHNIQRMRSGRCHEVLSSSAERVPDQSRAQASSNSNADSGMEPRSVSISDIAQEMALTWSAGRTLTIRLRHVCPPTGGGASGDFNVKTPREHSKHVRACESMVRACVRARCAVLSRAPAHAQRKRRPTRW